MVDEKGDAAKYEELKADYGREIDRMKALLLSQ
jgi:hypothetical protein